MSTATTVRSDTLRFQDRVQQALAAIPGVTGASATTVLPLTTMASYGGGFQDQLTIPGAPGNTGDVDRDTVFFDMVAVRANYVEVMGMRLVAGRTFTEARQDGVSEVMIDAAIARRFFPDGNAAGAEIEAGGGRATIVGVAEQARLSEVHADGRPQVLVRAEDTGIRPLLYVMRATRDPRSLLPDVQAAVRRVDPRVPVWLAVRTPVVSPHLAAMTTLGEGERQVLATVTTDALAILDDGLARRYGLLLKLRMTGTLGVLVRAKRAGVVERLAPVLDRLDELRFRLAPQIRREVLALAGEQE